MNMHNNRYDCDIRNHCTTFNNLHMTHVILLHLNHCGQEILIVNTLHSCMLYEHTTVVSVGILTDDSAIN